MSHVAIISTNQCVEPYPVYPLGMALVSAALANAGHRVTQFDLLALDGNVETILEALRASAPDVVCLSIRNMDNVDSLASTDSVRGLATAQGLVRRIREVSAAPILLGGAGFSIAPEAVLDFVGADYGVAGEGEQVLPGLIEALTAGRAIPRVTWAREQPMPMDRMPAPLHTPELVQFYRGASGMLNVQTKRGCPMCCDYCTYPLLEGTRFRVRPPEAVVDELWRLHREHGVEHVFLADSIFNDPSGHFRALLEAMIRAGLPVRWSAYFTPYRLRAEDVVLCKRAGLHAVELGTDASSDATLAGLGKGFSWGDVAGAARCFADAEIPCAHFVMFGGPGETMDTLEEGLRNIESLPSSVVFGFSGIRAFPGTPLHARGVSEGVVSAASTPLESVYYVSPQIDKGTMDQRIEAAWAGRRDRVFPPEAGAQMANALRAFGYTGLLWDKLLGHGGGTGRAARRRIKPGTEA